MTIRVLLVCEGTSDGGLMNHVQQLIIRYGVSDPIPLTWMRGRDPEQKIKNGLEMVGECDLLMVHRDADSQIDTSSSGPEKRRQEIESAISRAGYNGPWVGVVPVQAMESWLLLDESAIREVVGNPRSSVPLHLPLPSRVEEVSDPKQTLQDALEIASEQSGRRLARIKRDFPQHRRILLENLPAGRFLEQVPSWCRFRDEIAAALKEIPGL